MTRSSRVVLPLLLAATLLAACAAGPDASPDPVAPPSAAAQTTAAPAPAPSAAAPQAAPEPAAAVEPEPAAALWTVGATALPLRADGFGEVQPTPEVLRDRRLPTADLLPPPPGGTFASTVGPVTPALRQRMGESWSEQCPVGLADLRHLTVSFRGFDGLPHTGELVVAASVADDVVEVFRRLYAEDFPIEEMRLPTTADLKAPPTGDGNNTASYVCRAARGQKTWSQHAYGTAVDINPFHNPLVKGDLVVPELASAYADRDALRPGMHVTGSAAVRAFGAVGWVWGGTWRSSKDYMHFSQNGR